MKWCSGCEQERAEWLFSPSSSRCRDCRRSESRAYWKRTRNNKRHTARRLVSYARRRASRKNLPFDLKVDDIFIPDECPVLGIPLAPGGKSTDDSPTLDRVYPERGYVKDNVIVVSGRANRIKADATPEEIALVASFYLKYCKEK